MILFSLQISWKQYEWCIMYEHIVNFIVSFIAFLLILLPFFNLGEREKKKKDGLYFLISILWDGLPSLPEVQVN